MLDPRKRAYLVAVLGEERTRAIEERLQHMEKSLEAAGVDWRGIDFREVDAGLNGALGGRAGPQSFEELAVAERVVELLADFSTIGGNIVNSSTMTVAEKTAALAQAVKDLASRLKSASSGLGVGEKAARARPHPIDRHIDALTGTGPAPPAAGATAIALKELREHPDPAGRYVAALLEGGAEGSG